MRILLLCLLGISMSGCNGSNASSLKSTNSILYKSWINPNGIDSNGNASPQYLTLTTDTYRIEWEQYPTSDRQGCECDLVLNGIETAGTLSISNCQNLGAATLCPSLPPNDILFRTDGSLMEVGNTYSEQWTPY